MKINQPLFAGVTYRAVEDFSVDNDEDVSISESSNGSPSSLCFSTRRMTKKNNKFLHFKFQSTYNSLLLHNNSLLFHRQYSNDHVEDDLSLMVHEEYIFGNV